MYELWSICVLCDAGDLLNTPIDVEDEKNKKEVLDFSVQSASWMMIYLYFVYKCNFLWKVFFPTHTRAHAKCRQKDMYRFLPICHLSTDCYLLIFFSFFPPKKKGSLKLYSGSIWKQKYKNKQTNKKKWTRTSV